MHHDGTCKLNSQARFLGTSQVPCLLAGVGASLDLTTIPYLELRLVPLG